MRDHATDEKLNNRDLLSDQIMDKAKGYTKNYLKENLSINIQMDRKNFSTKNYNRNHTNISKFNKIDNYLNGGIVPVTEERIKSAKGGPVVQDPIALSKNDSGRPGNLKLISQQHKVPIHNSSFELFQNSSIVIGQKVFMGSEPEKHKQIQNKLVKESVIRSISKLKSMIDIEREDFQSGA
jgi:hypothetical protein